MKNAPSMPLSILYPKDAGKKVWCGEMYTTLLCFDITILVELTRTFPSSLFFEDILEGQTCVNHATEFSAIYTVFVSTHIRRVLLFHV